MLFPCMDIWLLLKSALEGSKYKLFASCLSHATNSEWSQVNVGHVVIAEPLNIGSLPLRHIQSQKYSFNQITF
jgi:hypothetical protein